MTGRLLALALLGACQFSEGRYADRQVARSEVIGEWRATPAAIAALREQGHTRHLSIADHRILLEADGTCEAKTVRDIEFRGIGPRYVDVRDGCRWQLHRPGEHQELLLVLTPDLSIRYSLAEEEGRLFLWQYAGDPDAWKYMEFEKVAAP